MGKGTRKGKRRKMDMDDQGALALNNKQKRDVDVLLKKLFTQRCWVARRPSNKCGKGNALIAVD